MCRMLKRDSCAREKKIEKGKKRENQARDKYDITVSYRESMTPRVCVRDRGNCEEEDDDDG